MKIELHKIKIKDLIENFSDTEEAGVFGYAGKLNIRPPYQREFVYDDDKRNKVIQTVLKGFPLNVMYWVKNEDGTFEVLDGQQRTISICQYAQGSFSVIHNDKTTYIHTSDEIKKSFEDYELQVYICEGSVDEKLEWFRTINIAAVQLKDQEIRNAMYVGRWVTDAKKYFSKSKNPATELYGDYIDGNSLRQEVLEKAIKWVSKNDIENYMAKNQHQPTAQQLYADFQNIMIWAKSTFPVKRKELKSVDWGYLYFQAKDKVFDPKVLEVEIKKLMMDEDVTKKSGIYPYLITKNEKFLNIRAFSDNIKREVFTEQNGICKCCGKQCEDVSDMEADHINPWSRGGKSNKENCQMLCMDCNRTKSGK